MILKREDLVSISVIIRPLFLIVPLTILLALFGVLIDGLMIHYGVEVSQSNFQNLDTFRLFSALLAAPVIEEFLFRYHFEKGEKYRWTFPFMLLVTGLALIKISLVFSLVLIGLCLLVLVTLRKYWEIYLKYHTLVLVISTVLFTFAHAFNFDTIDNPISVFGLCLLVYLLPGVLFGFVRIKYGYWYGVGTHALNNLLVLFVNGFVYAH